MIIYGVEYLWLVDRVSMVELMDVYCTWTKSILNALVFVLKCVHCDVVTY